MAKFLGLNYPIISNNSKGYFVQQSDIDTIKSDLLILLLTNFGERCLSGDTKIPLNNDKEYAIKDLVNKSYFWVFSFDPTLNMTVLGKAIARKTVENTELLEVTLDNGARVKCTSNHLWLLRDGEYCRTDKLTENDLLMPHKKSEVYKYQVVSVNKLDYKEDCYDLTVEQYHNFALSAGVFVHNCMLPNFGTNLRSILFEPNNAVLESKAKALIVDAITTWEPRIVVESIEVTSSVSRETLSPGDPLDNLQNSLNIKIKFAQFDSLQEIDELVLQIPIG